MRVGRGSWGSLSKPSTSGQVGRGRHVHGVGQLGTGLQSPSRIRGQKAGERWPRISH